MDKYIRISMFAKQSFADQKVAQQASQILEGIRLLTKRREIGWEKNWGGLMVHW